MYSSTAHPKVKAFISHGGGLSTQEAIFHATPVITLPIFADQPKNGEWLKSNGCGLNLVWEELTEEVIVNSIKEIVNNPR